MHIRLGYLTNEGSDDFKDIPGPRRRKRVPGCGLGKRKFAAGIKEESVGY